ncbi:MAG: NPXTG-anchored protein [Ruminococcus sp.]|nr:NPXTG-anchored protein [Ruminococcus sp.]
MKISKIFAGMSALAVAATMSLSAFAEGGYDEDGFVQYQVQPDGFLQVIDTNVTSVTFTVTADWLKACKDTSSYWGKGADSEIKDDDGNVTGTEAWDGFNIQTGNNGIKITSVEFSAPVKLHSELDGDAKTTFEPTGDDAINGTEGWGPVFGNWDDYIDSTTLPDEDLTVTVNFEWSDAGAAAGYTAFKPMCANGYEGLYKVQLEDGVTYIKDVPYKDVDTEENEDGYYVKKGSGEATTDDGTGAGTDTTTTDTTDTTATTDNTAATTDTTTTTTTGTGTAATGNTTTGASAGLALAGLALAGAAVVVSKKR